MAAKMGGFRSPNGIRKPELKGAGMIGGKGKALAEPMGSAMPGMPGMKKGGVASKKSKRAKK